MWDRCRAGLVPAEMLTADERAQLVVWFWEQGWTDAQIAEQTRMSTYTAGRIRAGLDLPPNEMGGL